MERNRGERRKRNYAVVARRKKIAKRLYGCDRYDHDGQYIKGKVGLCCAKTNDRKCGYMNWKHSDLQKIDSMRDQIKEYLYGKAS